MDDYDIVCVHVEAPDEASHEGRADAKVEALEQMDKHIVGPVFEAIRKHNGRILISPDHATLLRTKAHDRVWVPFAMAGAGLSGSGLGYNEPDAMQADGRFLNQGFKLMEMFLADEK